MTDIVVRGGTVVRAGGAGPGDIAIEDGAIAAIGPDLPAGREEVKARGLLVLPGVIDVHVHFNEPGRTSWEGAATGSRALAAGGGTTFFDMPLNSTPCTLDAAQFDAKRAALEAASLADFGLWGGLVPGGVSAMAELGGRGAVGFKAFMCDSGLQEFARADDATLLDGMREAARLRLPVAVHAESEELTRALRARMTAGGVRDFLRSRPVLAELEAIQRALLFARDTGVALHIVHMSSGRAVAMAAEAKAGGVDVSIETCPHYLFFTEQDVERLGAVAKCTPPFRPPAERDSLWDELLRGRVDMVASDHSPCDPGLREGAFATAWGGIAGVQSTLSVLLGSGYRARGLTVERICALVAENPARRFRIERKGALVEGRDADLVLVEPDRSWTLDRADLHQRHKTSPYVGETFRGLVRRTIRRGETIFMDGRITGRTTGRFVRPAA